MLADLGLADPLDHRLDLPLLGRIDVELDARVEILDVLAHHDQVDVAARGGHAGIGLRRPQVRVQVELLAERHVHRAKAGAELGRERALERDAVAPHRLESLFWKRRAALRHRGHADIVNVPLDLHAGGFDGAACGLDDLRARAIARDERDGVRQDRLPKTSPRPKSYRRRAARAGAESRLPFRPEGAALIRTRLTQLLGIRHPIVLGGMSGATGADLVAAVSEAGGLGTLGVSSMTAEEIRAAVETIRARTSRPFGLNLLLFTVSEDQIDAVVAARPRVIATAWPRPEDDLGALAKRAQASA